jgi:hypothetical protein
MSKRENAIVRVYRGALFKCGCSMEKFAFVWCSCRWNFWISKLFLPSSALPQTRILQKNRNWINGKWLKIFWIFFAHLRKARKNLRMCTCVPLIADVCGVRCMVMSYMPKYGLNSHNNFFPFFFACPHITLSPTIKYTYARFFIASNQKLPPTSGATRELIIDFIFYWPQSIRRFRFNRKEKPKKSKFL